MEDRPFGRKKNVGTGGSGVHKRGEALSGGPVGSSDDHAPGTPSGGAPSGGGPQRSRGMSPIMLIVIALVVILGGGGGLTSFLGGGLGDTDTQSDYGTVTTQTQPQTQTSTSTGTTGSSSMSSGAMQIIAGKPRQRRNPAAVFR